jgi:hypothetical protein
LRPPLPIVAGGKDSQTGRTEFRGSGHAGFDYTPEALLEGANTLYLVGPRTEQERLRAVYAALIQELVH